MASLLNRNTLPRRHVQREKAHTRLIVSEYSGGYLVHMEGRPDVYGCGKSKDEAVGDWVRTHRSRLGLEIVEL